MTGSNVEIDPDLDLVLDRVVDVPPHLVWEAWTDPEHLKEWFVPRPWTIASIELDLRPGGIFRTVMRSPEGEEFDNPGCCLEIVEGKKLVFTDTLLPGFRPAPNPFFTAIVTIEPHGSNGTRYIAHAIHGTSENKTKHEEMGFHEGWGTVLDQMVEYIKGWER
jgi:uncharacterized protein YndB with AHSA1/START domain